jgi:two-component system, OmpR family, response regulator
VSHMSDQHHRILVIDDDLTVLTLVGSLLEDEGYSITLSSNGLEAIKLLNSVDVDLVVLDMTMPGMDGLQVCRMIRANEKFKDLPILFLTARGDITDMMEARKVGADDYLVKPVETALLLKKIERLFIR